MNNFINVSYFKKEFRYKKYKMTMLVKIKERSLKVLEQNRMEEINK